MVYFTWHYRRPSLPLGCIQLLALVIEVRRWVPACSKVMEANQSCARTMVGTPYYLSPELVQASIRYLIPLPQTPLPQTLQPCNSYLGPALMRGPCIHLSACLGVKGGVEACQPRCHTLSSPALVGQGPRIRQPDMWVGAVHRNKEPRLASLHP